MVSETVNPEHIIFASRIEYGVALFLSSLEDCSTICSNDLSEDGNFSDAQCLVSIPNNWLWPTVHPFFQIAL